MNRDRGAVEERALVVADLRRQPEDVRRRGEAELRKAARPRHAEVLEVWAERSAPTPARAAGAAGDHRLHGNPISRHDVLDAGPDRSDLTGELVALRGARIRRQIELRAGAVLVQVSAADARRTHANDDFVGPGIGSGSSSSRKSRGPAKIAASTEARYTACDARDRRRAERRPRCRARRAGSPARSRAPAAPRGHRRRTG